jgi:glycogen synthase
MNTLCILHVASELAPLTGNGLLAREVSHLSSAMAELGLDVTVAVPGHRIPSPTSMGLARRLRPLVVPATGSGTDGGATAAFESTVHEGKLAGGRVKVLALEVPDALRQDAHRGARAFCQAAVTAMQAGLRPDAVPDVVIVGPGTEVAASLARAAWSGGQTPVTLLALRDESDLTAMTEVMPHVDLVVAPSPSRAAEVRALPATDPLGRVLESRRDAIHGILGGIDVVAWNPQHDGLDTRNDMQNLGASKAEHKRQLKRRLGLRGGAQASLLALVGPFDDDILTEAAAEELALCDTLLVVLAHAERDRVACQRFEHLARRGRGVLLAVASHDELRSLERELLCAADLTLFASRHPSTALCELHAMHYGVAPVAPRGPVYSDLLTDFEMRTGTGSGFLFDVDKEGGLAAAVDRALRVYRQPGAFQVLIERAAHFDLSWRTAAIRHTELILEARRARQPAVTPSEIQKKDVRPTDVHGDTAAASL